MNIDSINVGDKMFIMQHPVVIINVFSDFHIVKVSCDGKENAFYIDSSALSKTRISDCSISIYSYEEMLF